MLMNQIKIPIVKHKEKIRQKRLGKKETREYDPEDEDEDLIEKSTWVYIW